MTREKLSAIVTSFNEEVNIRECLESLAFADEVLLVDSFSTDRTLEIARQIPGVRILQREYFGSAAQKNWAMDQTLHPWILIVDADERVMPALAREIVDLLERGPSADYYSIRRRNLFLDRLIRHSGWSTDKVVRLVRRGAARYPKRRVHADIRPEGHVPTLDHALLHYTFRSLGQYLEKLHRYAEWGAADAYRKGKRPGAIPLFFRPAWRFVRMYVFQAGFLDGRHGLVLCTLQAYGVFLKWAKLWEWRRFEKNGWKFELPAYDDSDETWRGAPLESAGTSRVG
ncbi:MAG TPA: glycosyltransferase family 2 protein [Thermoanaerobaculia bacterium]|nr:glycosyltransferase family 2 protein [Thermoanaerobaculia bacterium]